jgi:hypothetical protein
VKARAAVIQRLMMFVERLVVHRYAGVPRPGPPSTGTPTSLSIIANAHPEHRLGGSRAEVHPNRATARNHLMASRDHLMLI